MTVGVVPSGCRCRRSGPGRMPPSVASGGCATRTWPSWWRSRPRRWPSEAIMADPETLTDPSLPPESAPAAPGGTNAPGGDWPGRPPRRSPLREPLADFKDVGWLAKRFIETKAMVGDAVKLPGRMRPRKRGRRSTGSWACPSRPTSTTSSCPRCPRITRHGSRAQVAEFEHAAHPRGSRRRRCRRWGLVRQEQRPDPWARHHRGHPRGATEQARALEALEAKWGPKDSMGWQQKADLARRVVQLYGQRTRRGCLSNSIQGVRPDHPISAMFRRGTGEPAGYFHRGRNRR